jgi:hypothetical protein
MVRAHSSSSKCPYNSEEDLNKKMAEKLTSRSYTQSQGMIFPAESDDNCTEMIRIREAKADRNLQTGARREEGVQIYLHSLGGVAANDGGGADGLLHGDPTGTGGG